MDIDLQQAVHFLDILGKNGDTRLRAFSHKSTPANKRQARKFGRDRNDLEAAQAAGLGVYVVINEGGDKKEDITAGIAYFAEFDGIPQA